MIVFPVPVVEMFNSFDDYFPILSTKITLQDDLHNHYQNSRTRIMMVLLMVRRKKEAISNKSDLQFLSNLSFLWWWCITSIRSERSFIFFAGLFSFLHFALDRGVQFTETRQPGGKLCKYTDSAWINIAISNGRWSWNRKWICDANMLKSYWWTNFPIVLFLYELRHMIPQSLNKVQEKYEIRFMCLVRKAYSSGREIFCIKFATFTISLPINKIWE